ncbi:hypothetical protein B296_00019800 [Ensete ventricosum]|uniref:Uncharacterized protein n=1 Tax=Ensete ventricosum TaxID=4639 RepID=A0A427B249_ENSVE|nr:hypothetical protein B296_00019800 [Ensete ventricosum]
MSAETLLSKAEGTSKDGILSTEHKKEGIWISISTWKPSSAGFSSKHFDIPFPSACLLPSILHNEYL